MSEARAIRAAKDTLSAFRQSVPMETMYEVATRRRWRHSICVDHICGCRIPGLGRAHRLNIHARSFDCHPKGEGGQP